MLKIGWRLLASRLLLTVFLIIGVGIAMREPTNQTPPEPPVTTTTTTTIISEWTQDSLNIAIETIANEEQFEDIDLLKQLAYHESRYLLYPKIIDTNGYYSYGLFHFQLYTFMEQAKLYKVIPQETTLEGGRILIMNPKLQIKTICRMGNDNINNIRNHWRLSWWKIYYQ